MPEKPEVLTVVKNLRTILLGKKLQNAMFIGII